MLRKMKSIFFVFLLLATSALALPGLTIEEFDDKFHVKFETPEMEQKAAEQLAIEEDEIEKENEAFEKGSANFDEELHFFDVMPPKDLEANFEGLNITVQEREYYTG